MADTVIVQGTYDRVSEIEGFGVIEEGIRKFLEKITYPIFFLDFETMQDAVPQFDGAKVYAQILKFLFKPFLF